MFCTIVLTRIICMDVCTDCSHEFIALAFSRHTNGSVKLPSFRHFQDRFLTANRENGEKKTGLCFARFVLLTFRGLLASHNSNPYPNRSRIARYNATKDKCKFPKQSLPLGPKRICEKDAETPQENLHSLGMFLGLVTRPKYPPLSRDRCSNTPVALCFQWHRRLWLLHPQVFPS